MKRALLITISLVVIAAISLTGIAAVNAKSANSVVECPSGSVETCDIFSGTESDFLYYLQGYVLDYDNSVTDPQQWISYQGGAFAPVYMEILHKGDFSDIGGNIPKQIRIPLYENVGIPQLGLQNQKGNIVRWKPIKTALDNVGNMDTVWVTSLAEPITESYTTMVDKAFNTYWWAKEDILLVYHWNLHQEEDQLVIDIEAITLQWFPNSHPRVAGNVLTDMSRVVSPPLLNLQRGEALEVINLYESKEYWSDPANSNWTVEYNKIAYVELQRSDGTTFIVATEDKEGSSEDADITNGCGARYRPYLGETLYVALARNYLDLNPVYPARPLREDEISQFQERIDTGNVDSTEGTIISERGEGQEYYITLQKEDGTQIEFHAWEGGTPPVGTEVIIYTYAPKPDYMVGIEEVNTGNWWFVEVREAIWDQCE